MFTCNPTKCVPKATYSWAIAKTTVDNTQIPVSLSKRVQIDEEGINGALTHIYIVTLVVIYIYIT